MLTLLDFNRTVLSAVVPRRKMMLALTWDRSDPVCLLASVKGRQIRIEAAEVLAHDPNDDTDAADRVGQWLSDKGVKQATTLVGLGRSQVDIRQMSLPPTRDDELPQLVRNQAALENGDISDEDTLDFYTLNDDPNEPRNVAAVALSPEVLQQARRLVDDAGQVPSALLLRSLASGSLLRRIARPTYGRCLLISLLGGEADVSILSAGEVVFARTVRFADELSAASLASQLATEIQRSIVTAALDENQTPERIYVFGAPAECEPLIAQLADDVQMAVSLVDPFDGVEANSPIPNSHRYAPLVGMIHDHVDRAHRVDFIHPKQPPPPLNYRRQIAFYGTVAAALLAIVAFALSDRLAQANATNKGLSQNLRGLERRLKKTQPKKAVVDAVHAWQDRGVNWLDELKDLSIRFPKGSDAVVDRMSMTPGGESTHGIVDFQVRVRNPDIVAEMEDQLRDTRHQVRSKRVAEQSKRSAYPWQFQATVQIHGHKEQNTSASAAAAVDDSAP